MEKAVSDAFGFWFQGAGGASGRNGTDGQKVVSFLAL